MRLLKIPNLLVTQTTRILDMNKLIVLLREQEQHLHEMHTNRNTEHCKE